MSDDVQAKAQQQRECGMTRRGMGRLPKELTVGTGVVANSPSYQPFAEVTRRRVRSGGGWGGGRLDAEGADGPSRVKMYTPLQRTTKTVGGRLEHGRW